MSERITFFHNPMSRGRIVHWMLEEVGAPYDVRLIDLEKGEQKSPEYLAVNPMGKVPAIVHEGTVVTEAAAICAYLADAFPAARLAPPADDPRRGTYLRWLFFTASCVEYALVDRMFSRLSVEKRVALGYGSYEDTLNALEKALTPGPYILGEWFTAADVYIASAIGWAMLSKALEPRPRFQAYFERCTQRPGYGRFSAQCDELAAQMKKRG
jgi:glutathione S-transferase